MFKLKKISNFFLLTLICVLGISSVSYANPANTIQPLWNNTKTVQTVLSFSDGQAICSLRISDKSGASRIKGTLTLILDAPLERKSTAGLLTCSRAATVQRSMRMQIRDIHMNCPYLHMCTIQ